LQLDLGFFLDLSGFLLQQLIRACQQFNRFRKIGLVIESFGPRDRFPEIVYKTGPAMRRRYTDQQPKNGSSYSRQS
jgi:hypothetical protein